MADPKNGKRCVYVLPHDLLADLRGYMRQRNLTVESEAVRRLLMAAIRLDEGPEDIAARGEAALSRCRRIREVAPLVFDHPLVKGIEIFDAGLRFVLKDGRAGAIGRVPPPPPEKAP